jgi:hypothetical protein
MQAKLDLLNMNTSTSADYPFVHLEFLILNSLIEQVLFFRNREDRFSEERLYPSGVKGKMLSNDDENLELLSRTDEGRVEP